MEKTIRRKTTDGLIWNTLQKLASKGLQLVFSILIARILVPEDYGLIAIANLFIALSDVLIDSGFSKALIRQNDKTEADYSTVFWFNLLASCTLYALLFAVAPLIAGYYQAEALAPIIRAISLSLIINAICGVQSLHMMVEMDFRSLAIMETSAMVIGGITALVLAMHGAGVWPWWHRLSWAARPAPYSSGSKASSAPCGPSPEPSSANTSPSAPACWYPNSRTGSTTPSSPSP